MLTLPNWEDWLARESVSLDEAAALTLNLAPGLVRTVTVADKSVPTREEYDAAMAALLRVQRGEAAPSTPAVPDGPIKWEGPTLTNKEGRARLQVLRECFDNGSPLLPPVATPAKPGHRPERRVRLVDVARFGRLQGWTMPPPLVAIGSEPAGDSVPTRGKVQPARREAIVKALRERFGNEHRLPFYARGERAGDPALKVAIEALPGLDVRAVRKLFQALHAADEIGPKGRQVKSGDARLTGDPAP